MNRMAFQYCLPLPEIEVPHGGRRVRPIPEVVRELFEVSDSSPSGLVWRHDARNGKRKAGDPAGHSLKGSNYYMVYVKNHGSYYAHRIAYFLTTGKNPGSMVVRHNNGSNTLEVGWQQDNLKDEKGIRKKPEAGYTTKVMYRFRGRLLNLSRLCKLLELPYHSIYRRIKYFEQAPAQVLADYGLTDIEVVHNY